MDYYWLVGSWNCPISANNIQIIYPACTKVLQLRFFKQSYHQPGVNLVRPHDLYLVSWEHHTSSIPLKTAELIRHDFLHIRLSISSIQVVIHEEFMAYWIFFCSQISSRGRTHFDLLWPQPHNCWNIPKVDGRICFLASENTSWAKIVDCAIGKCTCGILCTYWILSHLIHLIMYI